jgi:hypothetical protein
MTRPDRRAPHRSHHQSRRRRATSAAVAVLSTACLAAVLSACGNWITVTDAGQLGITVDAAGQPVVAVVTCSTARPQITLSEGRKKSDPDTKVNVQRGSWEARRAFSGVATLALTAPGENWKPTSSSRPLEPGRLFIVDGGTLEDDNASLGGVSFRTEDLAKLSPDQVQVNGKIKPLSAFGAYQCH